MDKKCLLRGKNNFSGLFFSLLSIANAHGNIHTLSLNLRHTYQKNPKRVGLCEINYLQLFVWPRLQ